MSLIQALVLSIVCLTLVKGDDHTRLKSLEREVHFWRIDNRPLEGGMEHFEFDLMTLRKNEAEEFLNELLTKVDKEKLSKKDQINYVIMKHQLETFINGYEFRFWNNLTPMSMLEGIQIRPEFFVDFEPFFTLGDFENYIVLLMEMPRMVQQIKVFFEEALRLGRTSYITSIDKVPGQIQKIIEVPLEKSVYYSPFLDRLEGHRITLPNPDGVREGLRLRGKEAVGEVFKAYGELKTFIETVYMNNTRPGEGVGSLAGGREFYKACLNWYLSLNMTPEAIHDLGLREVERVTQRMREIIDKQGYSEYSIREYFTHLREREDMFFDTEEEIIAEYEHIIHNRIDPILSDLFTDQPGLPIRVRPMPEDTLRGWYIYGSPDGSRPGTFMINTFRKVPKFTMPSLTMHEANPGHHLQSSYAFEASVPSFRESAVQSEKFRVPFSLPDYTAYGEGWALYAESLGVETGIYEKETDMIGYYESEIFRAARLVVDTGLHFFNWSREEAIDYFMNYTAESYDGITREVDRYITWPGQAVAYKIGELKIRALRTMAEQELGDRFDVRDFHMTVLGSGPVPLWLLEELVVEWVQEEKRRAKDELLEQEAGLQGDQEEEEEEECECLEVTTDPPGARAKVKARCTRSTSRRSGQSAGSVGRNTATGVTGGILSVWAAVLSVALNLALGGVFSSRSPLTQHRGKVKGL